MDPRKHLVLVKGKDMTVDVLRVARETGRTVVTFKTGRPYPFLTRNVEWLSNPVHISTDNVRFSISSDLLSDVQEVLRYGDWVKVFHSTGETRCCPFPALGVKLMKHPDGRSKDMLAYFRELAKGSALRTDSGDSLLAMKYGKLASVSRLSILSSFLRNNPPAPTQEMPELTAPLIFPFGCNMSQKMAVQAAILNPVSLVQGPPGTGKTQTILNLLANLLLQNKQVAVVSNNNSATANVLEKLKKYELDFLTAFLGSAQNKTTFIEEQSKALVPMPTLKQSEDASVRQGIFQLNQELDNAFKTKNELATVIQKIDALRLEFAHFEKFLLETGALNSEVWDRFSDSSTSTRELMKYWVAFVGIEKAQIKRATPDSSVYQKALHFLLDFLEKIRLVWRLFPSGITLIKLSLKEVIPILQKAYYLRKIEDLENERKSLEAILEGFRFDERLERLTALSMQLLKHHLAGRYNNRKRKIFALDDIRRKPEEFLGEYPIVLSTTFSVITSVSSSYLFDCVIVDEASQVDLLNGVLAMGCAKKIVIVGDPMQLPNVVTNEDVKRAKQIALQYDLPDYALFERHSLLSSVRAAFPDIPVTLLREHYRCHPKIIQFCNQKFYGGELLVMTDDKGEPDVLKAYVTVEGRHARQTFNQREIDELIHYVLPDLSLSKPTDIGIVSPYRNQVEAVRKAISSKEIEVDTVHKYQGREKRVMIITTVANEVNDFVDNPNLFNVAVSRAQEKLRMIVSQNMAEGNSNIADFVRYIRHSNCEVVPGRIRSIFDLLYAEYTGARLKALKKRRRISNYDSENLAYGEIEAVLQEQEYREYGVVSQFPLSMLIRGSEHLTAAESAYANHPWTKTDFLIYRKVDKGPVLVVEVDGYAFHREGTRQAERDVLKDSVLMKSGLPILRLSTVGSNERNLIRNKLANVVGVNNQTISKGIH